jgi:hypothetical protein
VSSPTKLNTGNPASRPVSSNLVLNAENRDVEREQLNRILNNLVKQINASSSSGSGGSITFAISNNDGTISVVSNGNTFVIGIADGGVSTSQLANNGVTTSKIATVNSNVGTFGSATQTSTFTVNAQGQVTGASNTSIAIPSTQVTDFTEAAQDAVGGMVNATLTYNDGVPSLGINLTNANSWVGAQTFTSVDINGGAIDGTSIGASTPSTGAFTTLTTTGNATLGDAITDSHTFNGGVTVRMATGNATQAYIDFVIPNTVGGGPNFGGRIYSVSEGVVDFSDQSVRIAVPIGGSATPVDHIKCKAGATSITGALSATGDLTAGNIAGTTWTPAITGITNVTGSTSSTSRYLRYATTVTFSSVIQINATAAGLVVFEMSLPISSNFSVASDGGGSGAAQDGTQILPVRGYASAANDRAVFAFEALAAGNVDVSVVFTYTII